MTAYNPYFSIQILFYNKKITRRTIEAKSYNLFWNKPQYKQVFKALAYLHT